MENHNLIDISQSIWKGIVIVMAKEKGIISET